MLLWLSFAVLSAVVLVALLQPLLRPVAAAAVLEPSAADSAVYRDQLAEIQADRESGLIGAAEAEAAEREIARRLLGGSASRDAKSVPTGASGRPVLLAAIALMPALALGIYSVLGAPSLPALPHQTRAMAPIERSSVDELIARVEARLTEHPEDGQGWDVVAPVYLRQQRFREAADAYAKALRLLGPSVKRLAGFAEASIIAADGIVGEEARVAYEEVLKAEPGRPEARFWLAMAKEQDGRIDAAIAEYRALLADAPADAAWRASVAGRLAMIEKRTGGGDAGRGEAPSAEVQAEMARLTPEQRAKAIGDMVEGLAARLAKDGKDAAGWLRLVRAYKVMGRDNDAVAALDNARRALKDDGAALAELDALAKSLGIGS